MRDMLMLDGPERSEALAITADLPRRNAMYVAPRERCVAVLDAVLRSLEPGWSVRFVSNDPDHGAALHVDTPLHDVGHGVHEAAAVVGRLVSLRDRRRERFETGDPVLLVAVSPLDHLELPSPRAPHPSELESRTVLELGLASLASDGTEHGIHLLVLTGELLDGLVEAHARVWNADVLRASA